MASRYCGQCGERNPSKNTYCNFCGEPLAKDTGGIPANPQGFGLRPGRLATFLLVCGAIIVLGFIANLVSPPAPEATPTSDNTSAIAATPTSFPATIDEWAYDVSDIAYRDVRDHGDLYREQKIIWRCNIDKFLGADPDNPDNTGITCRVFSGTFNGIGQGSILLSVPWRIDTRHMYAGDDVTVYGVVSGPREGANAFGATVSEPQIDVVFLTDQGHDPNSYQ